MVVGATRRTAAQIVVTGPDPPGSAARAFLRAEIDGVRYVPLEEAMISSNEALAEADMLLFVADAAESVDDARTAALAGTARQQGKLIGALVIGSVAADTPSGLLAVLRDAADMVVVVRSAEDVRAVVSALR